MSYILDALRKADAERERDPARGIHAQPVAGMPARASARAPAWLWPVAAAALAVVAGGALWWQRAAPVRTAPAVVAAPVAVPAVTEPPKATPVAAAVLPPAPPPLPAPVVEKVVARPAAAAAVAAVPAAPAAPVPAATLKAPAPVAAAAPAAAAASAPERIFAVAELPPEVQRELPKLAISGGVHSENAAQRLLIVGGQLMNEGAQLAPGVVLEQIRPRSAVLRFRGYRYSIVY